MISRAYGESANFAIALDGSRGPVVVWSDARGFSAEAWSDTSPEVVAAKRNGAVSLIKTGDGRLLAISVTGGTQRGEMAVFARRGGLWSLVERKPAVLEPDNHGTATAAPWGRRGYALIYNDGNARFTIEAHTAVGTRGSRYQFPVKHGVGFVAPLPDGSLGVLYGGRRLTGRSVDLRFSTLRTGRLRSRILIPDLQCNAGVMGVGHVGRQIRLAYGYGCDPVWALNTTGGKAAYNPFVGNRFAPGWHQQRFASAGGRVAFVGLAAKNRLTIRIVGPGL